MAQMFDPVQLREFAETYLADPILKMAVNSVIRNAPKVDAVEVVRCKDCEHYEKPEAGDFLGLCRNGVLAVSNNGEVYPDPDYYCPYGKRRTDHGR